ncbi:MAG: methionine--tRNA ligase [Acidobacteria bacterium]|nr:MAG: methionine--tRNA ligase [Acidobacteriota bacterium]
MRRFYVTTPIYYVNDQPHIGHTYTTIVADALARYHRLRGEEVYFLTGTDEHGQKMQRAAEARGVSPQQLADEVVENYRRLWPALGISHDDLIRTTEERHRRGVYALFEKIRRETPDAIYKGTYRGLYCTGCESFYPANQVKDGVCPEQGHPVEEVEEESWFFRLSSYRDRLLQHLEEHPEFVRPESRLNEVRGFLAEGLNDLSISRSRAQVSWGIPFPGDPEHVVYVWFDALTNYISALGYGSEDRSLYERFWGGGGDRVQLHLIGKDILRFHAVYWPAFLMAAGEPLPTTIFAHGWWLRDEAKMSKTRGNVVRPWPLIEDFGADALRWFLLREISLGLDGSYSDEALIERANADLANNIGNLFSRVVALVGRHEEGRVPEVEPQPDDELAAASASMKETYRKAFDGHDPAGALRALTEWADALNRFLVRHEPWRRAGREETCSRVLRTACGELAQLALHLHPAVPFASARLWRMLGLGDDPAAEIRPGRDLLAEDSWRVGGARVSRAEAVFPRLDKKKLLADAGGQAAPEAKSAAAKEKPAPGKEAEDGLISIDEFMKVRLRTARVVACEPHPNADKLLRLEIDLGGERRQLVAGIAKHYRPEELLGRTIVVVANLKPAKLRGLVSQGMLLAASAPDGAVRLLTVDGEVPPGCPVS